MGCPLAQLRWQSEERDRREHLPASAGDVRGGRLQVVTGKATRGGGRSVSRGRQEGSRAKLRRRFAHRPGAPGGVALPHGHGARWPGRSSARCAEPSCCPPPLTSASSPAHRPAHLQEPIRGLIAGDKVLRANEEHEAPATHGSDAGTTHPAPCVWASLASSLGLGLCLDP